MRLYLQHLRPHVCRRRPATEAWERSCTQMALISPCTLTQKPQIIGRELEPRGAVHACINTHGMAPGAHTDTPLLVRTSACAYVRTYLLHTLRCTKTFQPAHPAAALVFFACA